MQRFNISKPTKYKDRQGQERTRWDNVGTLVEFDRDDGTKSRIIEIPSIGLKANAFPIKPRQPARQPAPARQNTYQNEPIPTEEIPF